MAASTLKAGKARKQAASERNCIVKVSEVVVGSNYVSLDVRMPLFEWLAQYDGGADLSFRTCGFGDGRMEWVGRIKCWHANTLQVFGQVSITTSYWLLSR